MRTILHSQREGGGKSPCWKTCPRILMMEASPVVISDLSFTSITVIALSVAIIAGEGIVNIKNKVQKNGQTFETYLLNFDSYKQG
jgi:hypothetical protein